MCKRIFQELQLVLLSSQGMTTSFFNKSIRIVRQSMADLPQEDQYHRKTLMTQQ